MNDTDSEYGFFLGSMISNIEFLDQKLEIIGRDADEEERWRLRVTGSARFTFSNTGKNGTWLVEANFDAGGHVRSAERTVILATCGAAIDSFGVDQDGLTLTSDDGRTVEIPFALNEQGIGLEIRSNREAPILTTIIAP